MSTKSTDFSGKNYHVYHDAFNYLPTIEFNDKIIKAPKDFLETLNNLIQLQSAVKRVIELSKELDKCDGGLFMIDINKGTSKEL